MSIKRALRWPISMAVLVSTLAMAQTPAVERIIIRTAKPYSKAIAAIQAHGGTVTRQYKYVDAIAATIPQAGMAAIRATAGILSLTKDVEIRVPSRLDGTTLKHYRAPASTDLIADSVNTLSSAQIAAAAAKPAAYKINNTLMGLDPLHAAGFDGTGIVVAVIDSGIRPGFPHIADTVIGGEDFVDDGLGYSNFDNNGHGTFVSGMIASHVGFLFATDSTLVNALNAYLPGVAMPYPSVPGDSLVYMVGTAPAASVYALRVFGPSGSGSSSTVMAAMERAIELRELYNAGKPNSGNYREHGKDTVVRDDARRVCLNVANAPSDLLNDLQH